MVGKVEKSYDRDVIRETTTKKQMQSFHQTTLVTNIFQRQLAENVWQKPKSLSEWPGSLHRVFLEMPL